MSAARPPWLDPAPPWEQCPAPSSDAVVEVVGAPLTAAELTSLRLGRYVPLYGRGATADETTRALAVLSKVFSLDADARASEHGLALLEHPRLRELPYAHLATAISAGGAEPWTAPLALGAALVLGADDDLRARIADALTEVPRMRPHCAISAAAGGGSLGAWRDHYDKVCSAARRSEENERAVIRAMRAWYDWVLARRWSALDSLRDAREALPPLGRWLVDSALWIAGEDGARENLTAGAEAVLAPVQRALPRLTHVVARELAELVAKPATVRWAHLRCAAARDHAAMAIRHWLRAAAEAHVEGEDAPEGGHANLGPEPTRAGRAAVESRSRAGDFLLDWYVPDRAARRLVDTWAGATLRTWHRLHGAAMLGRVLESAGDRLAVAQGGGR